MRGRRCSKPVTAVARSSIPCARAFAASAALSGAFSIMWANGSPGFDLAREGEEHRPHRVLQLGVGDDHVEDRLRVGGDRVPHAERLEHAPRRGRDRRGAQVGPRIGGKCRIGDHDPERAPEPLAQREREREPGESAARDHHIGARNCWLVRHRPQRERNRRHSQ